MPKKYLKLLFLLAAVMAVFSIAHPALALEIRYPQIPGVVPNINNNPTLINFIQYFFSLALALAGIAAIISVVISGLKILIYAGNPAEITDAKEQLWAAALGIALLFASFIILRTINPQLVNPSATGLPQQNMQGVVLDTTYALTTTGLPWLPVTDTISAPQSNPDIAPPPDKMVPMPWPGNGQVTLDGTKALMSIRYACPQPTNNTPRPKLLVWVYSLTNFEIDREKNKNNNGSVKTYRLDCDPANNQSVSLSFPDPTNPTSSARSYYWAYEQPGAYFYLTNNCTGISSDVYTFNSIITPFDGRPDYGIPETDQTAKSIRIVNSKDKQYGVILNEEMSANGACTWPLLNDTLPDSSQPTKDICVPVQGSDSGFASDPKYAYVFQQIKAPNTLQVKFQSPNLYTELKASDFSGPNSSYDGRAYKLPDNPYDGNVTNWIKDDGQLLLDSNGADEGECQTPNESCLKKTRTEGGFSRIILYGYNEVSGADHACQIYTCQENNFNPGNNNRWILDSRAPYGMYVIPMPTQACVNS